MKIEDMPVRRAEITYPWIVDPEGVRTPCIRIHQEGEDEDNDIIIPLDKTSTFAMLGDLCDVYIQLAKQ